MQNIPGTKLENAQEQYASRKYASPKDSDRQALFDELFQQHSDKIENELALSPVTTEDKMLATAPAPAPTTSSTTTTTQDSQPSVAQSSETKSDETKTNAPVKEEARPADDERDQRMTQDDMDKVKDDLKEYGLSEKEIQELEDKVNSDEGLTWNQFVSAVAEKMAELRKIELSDGQKKDLSSFFNKLGFNETQSARLISQLENGEQGKVMSAVNAKLNSMSDGKQLLFNKDEVEAFSAAMSFSKEFTSKLKEMLGQNAMGKDLKEAFTLIKQEMAKLDEKDAKLVKAVGKAFAQATGKEVKETSVAKDIQEAVDLKPRVGDDADAQAMVKEDMKEALEERRDSMSESHAKKANTKTLPKAAEPQADKADNADKDAESDSDKAWNDFFGKLKDDGSRSTRQFQSKTDGIDQTLKTSLTDISAKTAKAESAAKTEAPKVLRQVESAFLKTLSSGVKQLTVQLTPEDLGKLSVALQVQGKEVSATIRAENAETAKLIHQNVDIIKQALENQGLKVDKVEVQAGLAGNQDDSSWFSQEQHNMARDREAMAAMRSHMRAMRTGDGSMITDIAAQATSNRALNSDGLHIVA